jgi:hypothetical protein
MCHVPFVRAAVIANGVSCSIYAAMIDIGCIILCLYIFVQIVCNWQSILINIYINKY